MHGRFSPYFKFQWTSKKHSFLFRLDKKSSTIKKSGPGIFGIIPVMMMIVVVGQGLALYVISLMHAYYNKMRVSFVTNPRNFSFVSLFGWYFETRAAQQEKVNLLFSQEHLPLLFVFYPLIFSFFILIFQVSVNKKGKPATVPNILPYLSTTATTISSFPTSVVLVILFAIYTQ